MSIVIEKRSADQVRCDIDCSALLSDGETITSVTSITATPDTTPDALTFGIPSISIVDLVYGDHTAATGTVVQVQINAGIVATGYDSSDYTGRLLLVTSISPAVEATFIVRVDDTVEAC